VCVRACMRRGGKRALEHAYSMQPSKDSGVFTSACLRTTCEHGVSATGHLQAGRCPSFRLIHDLCRCVRRTMARKHLSRRWDERRCRGQGRGSGSTVGVSGSWSPKAVWKHGQRAPSLLSGLPKKRTTRVWEGSFFQKSGLLVFMWGACQRGGPLMFIGGGGFCRMSGPLVFMVGFCQRSAPLPKKRTTWHCAALPML